MYYVVARNDLSELMEVQGEFTHLPDALELVSELKASALFDDIDILEPVQSIYHPMDKRGELLMMYPDYDEFIREAWEDEDYYGDKRTADEKFYNIEIAIQVDINSKI